MRPDYSLCDKCGDKMPNRPLSLIENGDIDEGSQSILYFRIDLCHKCLCYLIESYFNKTNYAAMPDFVAFIESAIRKI